MSKHSLFKAISVLTLVAMPVWAQETTTAPAADAPAATAPAAAEAAPPAPVTKETAQVGQPYIAAEFDLWQQICEKTEAGNDPCQLFQLLRDAEGNSVAEFSIFALPAGGEAVAGATIVAPLETLLTQGLTIAVDASPAKVYPFTFCTQGGCAARVGFTAEELAQFKKGAKATMTLVPAAAPDEKVSLDLSLKGFTAGYDAVAATAPAPAPAP